MAFRSIKFLRGLATTFFLILLFRTLSKLNEENARPATEKEQLDGSTEKLQIGDGLERKPSGQEIQIESGGKEEGEEGKTCNCSELHDLKALNSQTLNKDHNTDDRIGSQRGETEVGPPVSQPLSLNKSGRRKGSRQGQASKKEEGEKEPEKSEVVEDEVIKAAHAGVPVKAVRTAYVHKASKASLTCHVDQEISVFVVSNPWDTAQRQMIRDTWGSRKIFWLSKARVFFVLVNALAEEDGLSGKHASQL